VCLPKLTGIQPQFNPSSELGVTNGELFKLKKYWKMLVSYMSMTLLSRYGLVGFELIMLRGMTTYIMSRTIINLASGQETCTRHPFPSCLTGTVNDVTSGASGVVLHALVFSSSNVCGIRHLNKGIGIYLRVRTIKYSPCLKKWISKHSISKVKHNTIIRTASTVVFTCHATRTVRFN